MTAQAQRIAIAEECGLRLTSVPPTWYDQHSRQIPNYAADLNAMHEAEKELRVNQLAAYLGYLTATVHPNMDELAFNWVRTHATAEHRAEAFLKTIGRWKEHA